MKKYTTLLAQFLLFAPTAFTATLQDVDVMGRATVLSGGLYEFDVPCTSIRFTISGASNINADIATGNVYMRILVDGIPFDQRVPPSSTRGKVDLLPNNYLKPNQSYTIELIRDYEAGAVSPLTKKVSPTQLYNLTLFPETAKFETITPSGQNPRRIIFFGDSDSNGHDVLSSKEGTIKCLMNDIKYESCSMGFPAQVGRSLNAAYHVIAASGNGVTQQASRLYTPPPHLLMLDQYNRTILTNPTPLFDPQAFVPTDLVILIGGNDFYGGKTVNTTLFLQKYVEMTNTILRYYPTAEIRVLHLCGGEGNNKACPFVESAAKSLDQEFLYLGDTPNNTQPWNDQYVCMGERGLQAQESLAKYISGILTQ
eukprot:CFRG5152T1